jgi:lysine-specific permease
MGTELVGISAGESSIPEKNIPKSIKLTFWPIFLCYFSVIFVIGSAFRYDDPNLLKNDTTDIAYSPFTMIFQKAHVKPAAHIMNVIILLAVFSAGNSGTYASTRMLYSMALDGYAPKIFGRLTKRGVPVFALIGTIIVGAFGFLCSIVGPQA